MTQLNEEILAGIVERYKEALPRLRSKYQLCSMKLSANLERC